MEWALYLLDDYGSDWSIHFWLESCGILYRVGVFRQGTARDAAEGQLQELRRVASVVAAVAAARDRLERFVFKIQEKVGQEKTPAGTTLLEETQRWLADDTSVGGADPTSEADYADKLSALELAFPVRSIAARLPFRC